ncbi:probable RNA-dependent RNA polymerase 1 [Fagus crenata]
MASRGGKSTNSQIKRELTLSPRGLEITDLCIGGFARGGMPNLLVKHELLVVAFERKGLANKKKKIETTTRWLVRRWVVVGVAFWEMGLNCGCVALVDSLSLAYSELLRFMRRIMVVIGSVELISLHHAALANLLLYLGASTRGPDSKLSWRFVSYTENEGPFVLKEGSTLSCSSGLVPIVNPPQGFDLPYKILFKINSLIQHGYLPGQAIDVNFYELDTVHFKKWHGIGDKSLSFLPFQTVNYEKKILFGCLLPELALLQQILESGWVIFIRLGMWQNMLPEWVYLLALPEAMSVSRHEIEDIPDVEVIRGGILYCFSDGIGKISAELAQKATKCGFKNYVPSAFQIRYGGYKGVVAVDPTSSMKLSLRKSMYPLIAQEALEWMFPGESTKVLKEMLLCGYEPDVEPFLSMMLQTIRASKLMELRFKSRIFIPNGRCMMGCLDETRTLKYGQVFVQISRSNRGSFLLLKTLSTSWRCVRVLRAVDVPALHHMVDCVVFSTKGKETSSNECSGATWMEILYFVCWDPDLIPTQQIPSMEYIGEVQEYFTNCIVHDNLGIIDNAHTAFADKERLGAMSPKCIELAKLHSIAVDYPKSGVAAEIPHHLRVKVYPDFMEKSDKPTYESKHVIGKLFRGVKEIASHTSPVNTLTPDVAKQSYDPDMEVDGFKDYISDAFKYRSEYDYKLRNLMDYYGIETEAEILSGNILKTSKLFDRRRDLEAINYAVMALRKEARTWFNKGSESDSDTDIVYAKASACYHVTYHYSYWGRYNEGRDRAHFLSFPWCVFDKLIQIKKEKVSNRTV